MIFYPMRKLLLHSLFYFIFIITISYAEIVKKIEVVGNVRISKETIIVFGDIEKNTDYDAHKINELTKRLYPQENYSKT